MSFEARFLVNQINGDTSVMAEEGNYGVNSENSSKPGMTVLNCSYDFSQPIDHSTGTARGRVRAGLIRIEVESDRTTGLLSWLLYNQIGDGALVFYSREHESRKEKELNFEDASLVEYREHFNAADQGPMILHLEIFARKITMNNEEDGYSIEWQD